MLLEGIELAVPVPGQRGQELLALLLQGHFLKPVISYPKVQGKPFFRHEIRERIREVMELVR